MASTIPTARDGALPEPLDAWLDEHSRRRQGNKVLHGYPPPLLWRDREVPVSEVLEWRRATAARAPKRLIVYLATPYCLPTVPDRCGFCLFPSEIYRDRAQLDHYLEQLEIEGRLHAGHFDGAALEGVYFGGGTANLYSAPQYERLLGIVRAALGGVPAAAEVTLEGIPQLFSREKLQAMRAAGVTRVSIGAQQLDDELIRLSGRRQRSDQVLRSIEWCHELGLPCSVDLIFGWPRQTSAHMLADLRAVVAAGVEHVTHYELNVAGRSAFALTLREDLPSRAANLALYHEARAFLEAAGYRQRTAYDWERVERGADAAYRFESAWHRPLRAADGDPTAGVDMWGWGYAGVSCFPGTADTPGWTYLNHTRVDDYFAALAAGRFPVQRGHRYEPRDLRLHVLFQMLNGLAVDLAEYRHLFGFDLREEHAAAVQALERRGWAVCDGRHLRLVGDGVFHTPLVQTLFARTTPPAAA